MDSDLGRQLGPAGRRARLFFPTSLCLHGVTPPHPTPLFEPHNQQVSRLDATGIAVAVEAEQRKPAARPAMQIAKRRAGIS
jgi:hypothetical protein